MKLLKKLNILLISFFIVSCSSVPMNNEGDRNEYVSQFDNERNVLYGIDVEKMAKGAPLRVVSMVHTDLSPNAAWRAGLKDIQKWSKGFVTKVEFTKSSVKGKKINWTDVSSGDFRHCLNEKNGDLLVEKIRYINHKKRFYVYSVDFKNSNVMFPARNHTGAVTIESDGKGGSLLTFRGYFDRNWNPMSLIFPMMFQSQFDEYMAEFAKVYGGKVIKPKHRI